MQLKFLAVIIMMFCGLVTMQAQSGNPRKVKATIKTTAECKFCKENIESSLKKVKGIRKVECDYVKHEVYVVYNSNKISIQEIRTTLNKLGYDADDQKAKFEKYTIPVTK